MRTLDITWSVSRARDTYGYNVVTLRDGDKKFKANGGGYDMQGTVFGQWLWYSYADKIKAMVTPHSHEDDKGMYGYFKRGEWSGLDGACGLSSMVAIAKAIGLEVQCWYKKSDLQGIIVREVD